MTDTEFVRAQETAREHKAGKRNRADLIVYGTYLLLAGWVCARLWAHVGSRVMLANPPDHQLALWFLAHAARVVTDGVNPLYTYQLNVPDGVNLMANTSMLGLGIPAAPVTLLFGPQVSFALLMTLSLAGTATGWYIVLRRTVIQHRLAAAIGGGFCGFAPGLVSHAAGQLNWVAQFLLPFIVLAVLRLAKPGSSLKPGLVLGLLVTYQVFVNEELLLLTAVACGIFVATYALQRREQARAVAPIFVRRLGVAAAVAVVLLAYPLWFQFFGPGHYRGLPFEPNNYPADLWSYVAFARESLAGTAATAEPYTASATEENAFFGWAAVILAAALAWWLRRTVFVRAALVTAAVFAVLSLGRTVVFAGHDTGVPAPFRALILLPLGELLVPSRLALVVVPVIGLLFALGVDRMLSAEQAAARPIWIAALAAAMVPLLPTPLAVKPLTPAPSFVSDGVWREYVEPGRTAVMVPIPDDRTMVGQTWAAHTLTRLAIPAGYFLGPTSVSDPAGSWGPSPRPSALLFQRIAATGELPDLQPSDRDSLIADLRHWRASVVLLDPGTANFDGLKVVLEKLLGAGTQKAGVWIWDVRSAS